ncbi:MFS transporter [Nocardioides sp. zg-579]|uniref:MFS transporter n=1 Tax=Nocardioides marmotae TaxID=2663857 RepID=A0A6I3J5E5_9ACTN|nr:MFS transporter [Nocardioides marmotae]MCR6030819.1 MFS transporter [Gordonia jinghuaiqii]MTB94454.1 MFS transporter [Nocardioides marmotae]QKE01525.1 MFS transporter [Nocardioides marmotae]
MPIDKDSPVPSPTAPAAPRTPNPRLAIAVLCIGGLTAALTQTLVIPIQSDLPRLLDTSAANAAWVVTVTLLAGAVSMPLAGRLADLFGKKRVMVATSAILLVGSALVAMSSTLVPVLAGRALQGLAMGFIPVGISMIRQIVPPHLAGGAVAAMSATLGVGGAIGLPLSAWIVEVGDWHALFWVSTGLAAGVMVLTAVAIPHVHDGGKGHFDLVGALGLAVGLVSLLVGVSKATTWGWADARTLGAIAAGVLVLLVWGAFELRQAEPLVDLRATAKLPVLMTNLAAVAVGFGMMAQAIVVPQLLQLPEATGYGLGQSILAAGLWMAPGGLVMMLFAPVSGRLISTIGARVTLMIGAAVLGGGYLVAYVLMDAPWQLLLVSCILSAGVGIGYAAMPTLILDAVPPREAGAAVGLNALMRSVGTTVSAAVMGTLLTSNTMPAGNGFEIPTEGAFQLCFLVGAIAAFAGVAIAALIPKRKAVDATPGSEPVGAGLTAG